MRADRLQGAPADGWAGKAHASDQHGGKVASSHIVMHSDMSSDAWCASCRIFDQHHGYLPVHYAMRANPLWLDLSVLRLT